MALWTPADITTALWLDASDASTLFDATTGGNLVLPDGAIARLEDKSGNANHAIQNEAWQRPTRSGVLGGRSAMSFTDNATLQTSSFFDMSNHYYVSVFSPVKIDENDIIGTTDTNNGDTFLMVISGKLRTHMWGSPFALIDSTFDVESGQTYMAASDLNSQSLFRGWCNGSLFNSTTAPSSTGVTRQFGNGRAAASQSKIVGEQLLLNYSPTDDIREKIEGYLAHKWGLAANLPANHTYKTSAPGVYRRNHTLIGNF